ncbi:redoxin domain-containing protein [Dyella choica]|uniref:Redoxin domain-containing protein n=1 Tax=Dyella choica TaxID=1927959 RepID=A0A3S0RLR5_9GAMM|nr:redoxin domain-containing protein [Dyella choica]RUL77607.1 redoxin domain-containing protein [Dyella choica]
MTTLRMATLLTALGAALLAFWPNAWTTASSGGPVADTPAPDFTGADRWFNSAPLSIDRLRGKVVLVEFWTRECINCIHVLPHTKALYDKYAGKGLVIVGVHTPEYDEERDPALLQAALSQYQITWPVAMDNSYRIWNAYGNQYWPALYLIDQHGHMIYRHVGEGSYDETEQRIRQLLGNPQGT